ncbi:MAG: cation-transporting P-type ATPase, partial [Coriobacteriia bacterium]|nr:cation-transporting P-type ATPase [Coriobacteriia bacterium]
MQQEKVVFEDLDGIAKLGANEALALLQSESAGLSSDEVERRSQAFGKNILQEPKGKPLIMVFAAHFISPMAFLLWIGGFIALIANMPELGIAVWLVNIINGIFSFWQEYRAGKATEALKKMLPQYARVMRGGEELKILAEDLVPGDVILLEEGDRISSDARLLSSSDLQINQSALTGESNPVRKTSEPILNENLSAFETPNLIFAGTSVCNGTGKAVVIAIGMETEFGKIANLTQQMEEAKSPLQKELARLTKRVTVIATGIGLVFFLGNFFYVGKPAARAFMLALSVTVSFIPEGLLPTVTLSLAMAVQRMAKNNALVKHLSAVETLGATTVICSDKTGTLTQNEMTVSNLWMPGHEFAVTGGGYAPDGEIKLGDVAVQASDDADLKRLLAAAVLCSNARVVAPTEENPNYTVLGDPTEACLGVAAQKGGLDPKELQTKAVRIRELPFDSKRKRMTTVHQSSEFFPGIQRIAFMKGSPEEVMKLCTTIRCEGDTSEISDEHRSAIMKANDEYAKQGLRVLGVAYRPITKECGLPRELSAYTIDLVEKDLTFAGLIAMSDPPRPEVTAAVEQCHKAKVRIIMITGDYGLTAQSIAKRIGIVEGERPRMITGVEMADLSDDELKEALSGEIIFARMAPEQKYRVVCCLQETGNIVAVTGDGVNDSPALKKADIGIAMGIAGTDVAKEAADMILTDDNFASIVKAIREGRTVYNNIRKFLTYILTSNMSTAVPDFSFLLS